MNMRTQEELKTLHEKKRLRYHKHLHGATDTTSIILKGHLFVEELLLEILKLHCRDSKPLDSINLSFHHKLNLVEAIFGSHLPGILFPTEIWNVLEKLNKLRNSLAHNIDSPKASIVFNSFISSYKKLSGGNSEIDIVNEIPVIDSLLGQELVRVILYLLGFLGCIHGIAFLNPPSIISKETPLIIPDRIDH